MFHEGWGEKTSFLFYPHYSKHILHITHFILSRTIYCKWHGLELSQSMMWELRWESRFSGHWGSDLHPPAWVPGACHFSSVAHVHVASLWFSLANTKRKEKVLRGRALSASINFPHTYSDLYSFNSQWRLSLLTTVLPISLLLVIPSGKLLWQLGHLPTELSSPVNHTLISARMNADCQNTHMNCTDTKANQHLILPSVYWTMRLTTFHQNLLYKKCTNLV